MAAASLLQAGAAGAHSFTAAPVVAPVHASPAHPARTIVYARVAVGGVPGQIAAAGTAASGQSEIVVYAVPSEAARYQAATGRVLPLRHGIITLPPATPRGDFTYIWASPSGD